MSMQTLKTPVLPGVSCNGPALFLSLMCAAMGTVFLMLSAAEIGVVFWLAGFAAYLPCLLFGNKETADQPSNFQVLK